MPSPRFNTLARGILAGGGGALGPSTGTLEFAGHVSGMLAAMKATDTQRTAVGWHGMSINVGAGSGGFLDVAWHSNYQTESLPAQVSATINTAKSGTFRPGVELVSSTAGDNTTPNSFFTLGGTAFMGSRFGAFGPSGQQVGLTAATAKTIAVTISGSAGQVVRFYGACSAAGVLPRYSMSGANTVATTNLPATTTTTQLGTGSFYAYDFSLTLTNAGSTTITILAPTSGSTVFIYGCDPQYDASTPGLTIHRLSQSGSTLSTLIGESLDNTDTQPAGTWIGSGNAGLRTGSTDTMVTRYGLSGVFAGADINDIISFGSGVGAYNYGWTLADHERHLTNYVNAMAARSMPVIFVVGHLRHTATPAMTGNPYTQSEVIATYRKVARASSNAAFIDLSAQWGTGTEQARYDAMVADTSRWVASEAPRYVHPGTTGHAFFGAYVANAVMAAW